MNEINKIVIVDEKLSVFKVLYISLLFIVFLIFVCIGFSDVNFSFTFNYLLIALFILIKPLSYLTIGLAAARKYKISYFVENNNLQIITDFFLYKYTKTISITQFDYVAVNSSDFFTTSTLWYNENKHLKLVGFSKKEDAFIYSKALARTLKTDLLNKIDVKNPIWTAYQDL